MVLAVLVALFAFFLAQELLRNVLLVLKFDEGPMPFLGGLIAAVVAYELTKPDDPPKPAEAQSVAQEQEAPQSKSQ